MYCLDHAHSSYAALQLWYLQMVSLKQMVRNRKRPSHRISKVIWKNMQEQQTGDRKRSQPVVREQVGDRKRSLPTAVF